MSSRMGVLDALCPCGCEKYSQENLCDHLEEAHAEMLFMCNIPQCDSKRMYYWKLHHLRNHIEHQHNDFRKEHRNLFDKEKKLIVSNATLANDNIILYPLDLKEFRCGICNSKNARFRSFLLKNAVNHVTETHPTERRPHEMLKYRCRECCRDFLDEPDLQRHVDAEHAKEMERAQKTRLLAPIKEELDSDIEIIDLLSTCSFCKNNVAESESRAHLKTHYDCLFQCDACHLGFEEYQKIEEHILSCNDIPLSTKLSRRAFIKLPRQRECLNVFKCCVSNCDRKFIGQPAVNIIDHMKASHRYLSPRNNMSLYCRICGNATMFNSSEELENHINNNHPEETRPRSLDMRSPEYQPFQSGVESRRPDCSHLTCLSETRSSQYQPFPSKAECRYPEYRLQTPESDLGLPKYRTIQSKDECKRPENRRQAYKSDSGSPEYPTTHKSDSGSPEYQIVETKDVCRHPGNRRQTHESDSGSPQYQKVESKDECRRPEYRRQTHESNSRSPEYQEFPTKSQNEWRSPDNSEYGCEMYERQIKEKSINVKRKTSSKMRQDKRANRFSSSSDSSSGSSSSSEEDSSSLEEDTRRKSLAFAKSFNKLKEREKFKLRRKKSLKSLHRKGEKMSDSEITSGNDSEGQIMYKKKKMSRESSLPRKRFISRDDTKKKLEDENEIFDGILDRNISPENKIIEDRPLCPVKTREDRPLCSVKTIEDRPLFSVKTIEDIPLCSVKTREDLEVKRRVELDKLKLHNIEKKIKILSESSANNLERSEICDKKNSREPSYPSIPSKDGNQETIISENGRGGNLKAAETALGEDNSDTQTTNVENVTKKKQKTKANQEKVFQLSFEKKTGQNRIFNIHCAFCEKDFGDVTEMRAHVSDEHTEMLFKCKLCSKSSKGFETTRGLMDHMKKTHGMNKLLEQIIGEESSRESVQLPEKFLYKIACSHNNCTTMPELGRNGLWLGRNLTEVQDDILAHNRLLHRINPLCSDQVRIELTCRACNSFKAVDALGKPDQDKWNKHFNIDHVKRFAHNYKLGKQKKKS